jgi:peptide/nickel transport system permease protein
LPYGAPLDPGTGLFLVDSLLQGQLETFRQVALHLVLPATTLALGMVGIIARITRSAIVDVGQEDFIYTAVAKGLTRGAIVRKHLLPNSAIPISTIIGLELGVLISGTIIAEVVFSWPGVGTLLYQAVSVRDTPLTTGVVVVYTMLFILLNVCIDLFYFIVDPRVRAAGGMKR